MRLTKDQKRILETMPDDGELSISHRYSHSWGYVLGRDDGDGTRQVLDDNVHILTIRALERKNLIVKVFDGNMLAGRVERWHKPCDPALGVQGITGNIGVSGSNEGVEIS
jgi:hypothetical protein